jgi:hypothetical protein
MADDHEDYETGAAPAAHKESHQLAGADQVSVAGLSGETAELAAHKILPIVHQDAPALILTHKGDAAAHHAKYTDAEAVSAIYAAKPCFSAVLSAQQNDVTGDGTAYNITGAIWTELLDQGNNFSNGSFTAPASGIYLFSGDIALGGITALHTYCYMMLITSNRNYIFLRCNPGAIAGLTLIHFPFSFYCDMDLADTAFLRAYVSGSFKVVDVTVDTFFGGSRIV